MKTRIAGEGRIASVVSIVTVLVLLFPAVLSGQTGSASHRLEWSNLPSLPNELGVAGPFVGVHKGVLLVAGGANFATPVWENDKAWSDVIDVLVERDKRLEWQDGGRLTQGLAYGASVSTADGVVCMGGNDSGSVLDRVFLMAWDPVREEVTMTEYPRLPQPCCYGAAALLGDTIYLAGGQSGLGLDTAMANFWSLDLSRKDSPDEFLWKERAPWPGVRRAFNVTVDQHNGYDDCIYVIGGRYQKSEDPADVGFLADVWEYNPANRTWRQRADAPRPIVAGTAIGFGQSHIFALGGADGSLFFKTNALKDDHPGFPKCAYAYHTITNTWTTAGSTPQNHVTTTAVRWGDSIIIPSGEIRPRVRSPRIWRVQPVSTAGTFGWGNYGILSGYLLAMVGVGLFFARRNRNTDDFFRGGRRIPWWAAGCSIFATMLSSLTFTGVPSKSYAQNWVYAMGNLTIPLVAVLAVYVAMPFFRRIDATTAYEYLELRFNRSVRWFGSFSFTLFHVFRMAIVMSLTGLALSVATPLAPAQSVLIMGVLSITYCTFGGIEAVIWTDTIQTFVLLGGAVLALVLLISGVDGGWDGFLTSAIGAGKFSVANLHWDATSSQIALWVVIVGGVAQNVSSYTADQAVVQRYMTTPDEQTAARSIWTNALLTIPSTLLFFGIGTALFSYYHSHPEKLDPTITTDQVFPFFIATEMPVGIAGLMVAAIFAAAQSTVSTSMNSTATAIVTDFMRPLDICRTERGYLRAARIGTLVIGVAGTLIGTVFVNPEIKSLFDAFIKLIGLFMGVLGGLFVLGAVSRKANAFGAMFGAVSGALGMFCLWRFTPIHGYLYTASGIVLCVGMGYVASHFSRTPAKNLDGLTIHTLAK